MVRCGLERPVCHNCSRLSKACNYAQPTSSASTSTPGTAQASQATRMRELELMYFYAVHTYSVMSHDPVRVRLWRDVVPKHAFQHPFLLHGLLSIAAQHRLHFDKDAMQSADLVQTAEKYQQEALASYIGLLNNITEANCHALFAFSQIIVAIQLSRLSLDTYPDTRHPHGVITCMIEIFELLKGALIIAIEAIDWLRAGDLEPMLGPKPDTPPPTPLPQAGSPSTRALASLSEYIASEPADGPEASARIATLLSTVRLIHSGFLESTESRATFNNITGIPVFFDVNYLRLLKMRDEAALVVLAYYGILLHQVRRVCFVHGTGVRIVAAVAALVGEEWAPYMTRPQLELDVDARFYSLPSSVMSLSNTPS
ncbi:hypothetical protein PV08_02171 [Exophiala spinifera]|uniref:Zn(2)-C6 fungal-type domain-containing protein n=1 Tax=Exophiala spinifera TaxID=91928 RepID=A0A0D1Z1R5_9EURO|nr:uncharacterized protein PV08_02171 [Exophiala spinifera]KIW21591.1 hypothetical protein PV08_02171 [Exophiala spinifera]